MGATTFGVMGRPGEKDVKKAYDEACAQARDEYGHQQGYNGTISTTSGVKVVLAKPVPASKLSELEEPYLDGVADDTIGKWMNAGAIAVAGADGHTFHRWYFFGWAAE